MKILLNGETYQCEDDSLYGLLKSVNVLEKRFAVEVDGNIIPSSLYKKYKLKPESSVEIVIAVGGGWKIFLKLDLILLTLDY